MRSSEWLKELVALAQDIESDRKPEALERLHHITKVAYFGTFKSEKTFLEYLSNHPPKPKLQLYERITTWRDPNTPSVSYKKIKLKDIEELIKKPFVSFGFTEVSKDYFWIAFCESHYYDDAPVSTYRYFGFKIAHAVIPPTSNLLPRPAKSASVDSDD